MIQRQGYELRWVKPKIYSEQIKYLGDNLYLQKLYQTIQETGLPSFEEASSPEQEAILLLEVAAEIEHALLVEYLYSAYSIENNEDFQDAINDIAVQEMGHLITVQNLLLAIGGNVYFERQDESPQASLDPFPFTLEPFSKSVLAKYVLAEMPLIDDLPDEEKAEIEEIKNEHQLDIGMQINRIGALYLKLYWLFQSSDEPEGPLSLSKDVVPEDQWGRHIDSLDSVTASINFQTDASEWRASVIGLQIDLVSNRADALEAIYRISAQGEGFTGEVDSHFKKFRELYRQYDSAPPTIRDVPTNPFISTVIDPDPNRERNRISNPVAQILVELADIRYKKMLLHFIQLFSYNKTDVSERKLRQDLIQWSLGEMRKGIRTLSRVVLDLPRTTNMASSTKAALVFTIPREVFPTGKEEQWKLLNELIDKSEELQEKLASLPDLNPRLKRVAKRVLSDDPNKRLTIAAQTTDATDSPVV